MLRSFSIQPASLVLGLVFGVVCLVAMGQTSISTTPIATPVRVEYVPAPRDLITIRGGTPFTVPQGQVLVITALGNSLRLNYCDGSALTVDGVVELMASAAGPTNVTATLTPVPPGFAVHAGSVVALVDSCTYAEQPNLRAWGYLAPR